MTQKRFIPSDSRPSKRIKSSTSDKLKKPKPQSSEPKTWKAARLDSLDWRSVQMPDRLDDVEGFMGLEEVDDVQVENLNGLIGYKVPESTQTETEAKTINGVDKGTTTDSVENAEEWTGFEDEEVSESQVSEKAQVLKDKAKKKKEKLKKLKKNKDSKKAAEQKAITSNSFAAIAEGQDDEDFDDQLPLWNELELSDPTKRALTALKFTSPTPIQSSAIPHILSGHDVIGKASTGSGKTLAFGIPIFEYWQKHHGNSRKTEKLDGEEDDDAKVDGDEPSFTSSPTALIISPTRELAHQITSHIVDLTTKSGLASPPTTVSVTGGLSLQKQTRQLTQFGGADIVVATPGRLWELLREGRGFVDWIRGVKFLVFDEADRVLQEGHYQEVEEVLNLLQRDNGDDDDLVEEQEEEGKSAKNNKSSKAVTERQVLVFSATFSKDLQKKLAGKLSYKSQTGGLMGQKESLEFLLRKLPFREENPKWLDMNPVIQMTSNLKEGMVECGNMEKDLYLYYLLLRFPARTLIFTNSISTVRRLTPFLTNLQLPAHALHSSMIQKARLRSLERFTSDGPSTDNKNKPTRQNILISTDVAARGLDIKNIDLVIHYHVPRSADTYVHRSGRTARASKSGVSILLCSPDEVAGVRRLIGKLHDKKGRSIKTIFVDRVLVTRLRTRVELSQKLTSSNIAKDSHRQENDWLKTAAEELGVEYESDEFTAAAEKGRRGGMKKKAAREVTKDEMTVLRAQLNSELKKMVGAGSRTYITSGKGGHNLAQRLIEGKGHDVFYGEMGVSLDELF